MQGHAGGPAPGEAIGLPIREGERSACTRSGGIREGPDGDRAGTNEKGSRFGSPSSSPGGPDQSVARVEVWSFLISAVDSIVPIPSTLNSPSLSQMLKCFAWGRLMPV